MKNTETQERCAMHNVLETEEFISPDKNNQFDYTEWQRQHFDKKTAEQIRAEAEAYVIEHPYAGDSSTII